MNSPIIGIISPIGPDPSESTREICYVGKPYIDRIIEAGGVPILVPPGCDISAVLKVIDGWMIIGGRDIDPKLYGQDLHPSAESETETRTQFEIEFSRKVPAEMPILGICYGCQLINVLRGGSLHQHIPDFAGTREHTGGAWEDHAIERESKVARALGKSQVQGKSYHHQSIDKVGNGLKVVSKSSDGIIEAVESADDRWIVGIQWHPERSPELEESQALFRTFVEKASAYKQEKESCGTW